MRVTARLGAAVLWCLAGFAVLGGPGSGVSAQQAPDRSAPPKPGVPPTLRPPSIVKRTLSNGLPVWIVELHKVPVAHVSVVVRSGSGADPGGRFGLASLTADMLDEGAGSRNALAIADAVDYLGATIESESTFDSSTIDLHVPSARLGEALPVFADVILHPTFPDKELQRLRQELLASLVEAEDDPESLIRFAFPRLVYGSEHRYGSSTFGTATSINAVRVEDLREFHARTYVPSNAVAIVTGDVTPDAVVPVLESVFGSWKGSAPAPAALAPARQLTSRQVYLIDKPGAAQSQIRIGWIGVPRSTPDYFALRVLNTILGGAFTSRLNTNLREEHGYAYGASSSFEMRLSAGPFFAAAGVQTDKTAEALTEFFKEIAGIRRPVPAGELEKAKNYLSLLLPRNFETSTSVARSLGPLFVYNLPDDYFASYTSRVRAVTEADVRRAAEKYIDPAKLAAVVIGDRKAIEPGIKALNLGPLTIVTAADVMK
jgi:zinc protease